MIQTLGIGGTSNEYRISVSKFCCPICWELIDVLNETNSDVQLIVRACHSNLYTVSLPSWLPNADIVVEKMIQRFGSKLYEKFGQLPLACEPVRGHKKSLSLESAGESVSSIGSTFPIDAKEELDLGQQL